MRASDYDASRVAPRCGVLDTSCREEALGQTRDSVDRFYLSASLAVTQCPNVRTLGMLLTVEVI